MIISLDLSNKSVLVVGSDRQADQRASQLAAEGADVTLFRSEAHGDPHPLHCKVVVGRGSRPARSNLRKAFLVIATERDKSLNRYLYRCSIRYGYLLNTLDDKATCNFFNLAVRNIGPSLQIAVSTRGVSPAFCSRLSSRLAASVTKVDLAVLDAFSQIRTLLKSSEVSTFDLDWDTLEEHVREGRYRVAGSDITPPDLAAGPRRIICDAAGIAPTPLCATGQTNRGLSTDTRTKRSAAGGGNFR